LTQQQLADMIIPVMDNYSVARKLMSRYPGRVPGAGIRIAREDEGPSTAWTSQGAPKHKAGHSFSSILLKPEKLTSIVPMNNEFIRDAVIRATEFVKQSIAKSLARREDLTFLGFDSDSPFPDLGVYQKVLALSKTVAWGAGADPVIDISNAMGLVEDTVRSDRLRDPSHRESQAAQPARRLRQAHPYAGRRGSKIAELFYGVPIYWTRQVPKDPGHDGALGGGSKTAILMGQFDQAEFGDTDLIDLGLQRKRHHHRRQPGEHVRETTDRHQRRESVSFALQQTASAKFAFAAVINI
jgi:hypothetical protein